MEILNAAICYVFLILASISTPSHAAKPCPGDNYLRLVSGGFTLCLSPQLHKNLTIAKASDLLVKLPDGSYFGLAIVLPLADSLPETFDMRMYPEYALGLKKPQGMTKEQTEVVANSLAILKTQFGPAKPAKYKNKEKTIYTISSGTDTQAYVAAENISDQVLFLTFHQMDNQKVNAILEGVQ